MNHFPNFWVKIPKFDNYHPPLAVDEKDSNGSIFGTPPVNEPDRQI